MYMNFYKKSIIYFSSVKNKTKTFLLLKMLCDFNGFWKDSLGFSYKVVYNSFPNWIALEIFFLPSSTS